MVARAEVETREGVLRVRTREPAFPKALRARVPAGSRTWDESAGEWTVNPELAAEVWDALAATFAVGEVLVLCGPESAQRTLDFRVPK